MLDSVAIGAKHLEIVRLVVTPVVVVMVDDKNVRDRIETTATALFHYATSLHPDAVALYSGLFLSHQQPTTGFVANGAGVDRS